MESQECARSWSFVGRGGKLRILDKLIGYSGAIQANIYEYMLEI
jgi:hypothetical protein